METRNKILGVLQNHISNCTKCKLHESRTNAVLYRGNSHAKLMFLGEAPGQNEDREGKPFVGRAGKLLDNIILATGFKPEDVYVCNVVDCRPPNNRKPEQDEISACIDHLKMQIEIVKPKVIMTLGATATEALLGRGLGITKRRGKAEWYKYDSDSAYVVPTYHPAYLLRNPNAKKEVWDDVGLVLKHFEMLEENTWPKTYDRIVADFTDRM